MHTAIGVGQCRGHSCSLKLLVTHYLYVFSILAAKLLKPNGITKRIADFYFSSNQYSEWPLTEQARGRENSD
jgi:hypothetical protein